MGARSGYYRKPASSLVHYNCGTLSKEVQSAIVFLRLLARWFSFLK